MRQLCASGNISVAWSWSLQDFDLSLDKAQGRLLVALLVVICAHCGISLKIDQCPVGETSASFNSVQFGVAGSVR